MLRLGLLLALAAGESPVQDGLVVDDDCKEVESCALNAIQIRRCPFDFEHDVKELMLNMSKEIDSLNDKLVVLVAKAMRTSTKD